MSDSDREAFAREWAVAQPAISAFVASLVWDRAAADDVVQEAAAAAWAKFAQFDPAASFTAWCLGFARIAALRQRRAVGRSPVTCHADIADVVAEVSAELASELEERERALRDCVRGLGERAARLLTLRYVEALSPSAIAAREGIAANAVRVGLHRIRAALEACIRRRSRGARA